MKIKIIVAISNNNAIGKDNLLLWKLSTDLKMFKELTTNNVIIMGRKTFDSLGKALPNRINMVITRNKYFDADNVVSINNLNKAIELSREYDKDVYVIGGGQIYEQAMPIADELIVTHVNCEKDADTFFPTIDLKNWQILSSEKFGKDSKNEYDFEIVHYIRK